MNGGLGGAVAEVVVQHAPGADGVRGGARPLRAVGEAGRADGRVRDQVARTSCGLRIGFWLGRLADAAAINRGRLAGADGGTSLVAVLAGAARRLRMLPPTSPARS